MVLVTLLKLKYWPPDEQKGEEEVSDGPGLKKSQVNFSAYAGIKKLSK